MPRDRRVADAHRLSGDSAKLRGSHHRDRLYYGGERDPARGRFVIPRSWRSECDLLGRNGRDRAATLAFRDLPLCHPGPRNPPHRALDQPLRRGTDRSAKPAKALVMSETPPLLNAANVSVRLPSGADRQFAIEDVSLRVQPNEIICVVGESGSGKSMLANAMIRLLPPSVTMSGSVHFGGHDIMRLPD